MANSVDHNETAAAVELLNPFTPEFLKWTFPSLNLDTSIAANRDISKQPTTEQQTE